MELRGGGAADVGRLAHRSRAGARGSVADRYVGYYEPYATSHDDLDRDEGLQIEVKNHALALVETARQIRSGQYRRPDEGLEEPRKK